MFGISFRTPVSDSLEPCISSAGCALPHQGSYVDTPYGKTFLTIDLNLVECALMSGPSTWHFNATGPDAVRELSANWLPISLTRHYAQTLGGSCQFPVRPVRITSFSASPTRGVLVRQADVMRLEPPDSDILAARP